LLQGRSEEIVLEFASSLSGESRYADETGPGKPPCPSAWEPSRRTGSSAADSLVRERPRQHDVLQQAGSPAHAGSACPDITGPAVVDRSSAERAEAGLLADRGSPETASGRERPSLPRNSGLAANVRRRRAYGFLLRNVRLEARCHFSFVFAVSHCLFRLPSIDKERQLRIDMF